MLFLQLIRDGGPIMWVILFCSIVAMFIFVEKWFQFHREQVNVRELINGLVNVLKRDGFVEAISLCDNTPGPVGRILAAAILAYEKNEDDPKLAIEDAALVEVPKLERGLNMLASIAYVSPMLGLIGTVLGMMGAFNTIHSKEGVYLSAADLAGDINLALITTAAGLCVAVPGYLGYNYLVTRVESFILDMEKASSEIMYFFRHHKRVKDLANVE